MKTPHISPLYRPEYEHDACGVGFIANYSGVKSRATIDRALEGLQNLAHRGALDADSVTGDGVGILTQIPYAIFSNWLARQGQRPPLEKDLAVAVIFLSPLDREKDLPAMHGLQAAASKEGLHFLAWRECPVNATCLGKKAAQTQPLILHALFARGSGWSDQKFERRCFLAMKGAESEIARLHVRDFYIASFSSRTITYKGLLSPEQLSQFYLDLSDPAYSSSFALFHQRFATNTLPDWRRAQPLRMMAHNGEINTVRGNRNWMRAREHSPKHGVWGKRYADLSPMIQPDLSDSASFDNALQLLTVAGRSSLHSLAMMMPHAWEKDASLTQQIKDFYQYHSLVMEPWDGPAAIVFTDGRYVGASLDRNGLRPLRYKIYADHTVVIGSEAGMIADWGSPIVRNGRLGPGRMLAVDMLEHKVIEDMEIKQELAAQGDYGDFLRRALIDLSTLKQQSALKERSLERSAIDALHCVYGYDRDEQEMILLPMLRDAQEALGAMGDDTPLAVLSRRPRLLYSYFKQLFAQVTNPPIDPLRESLVMSLRVYLGGRLGLFDGMPDKVQFYQAQSPLLLRDEFSALLAHGDDQVQVCSVLYRVSDSESFKQAVQRIARTVCEAVTVKGGRIIVLSDRGVDREHAAVPMLLAVGAAHQALVRSGLRMRCDLVADTAEARDVHQIACLLGFGVNAVHPWLALETIHLLHTDGRLEGLSVAQAQLNYRKAIDKGLLKILSKMGISTLFSYQAGQMFEAIGIGHEVIEDCFTGTPSPIGGIGYAEIGAETMARHQRGFPAEGSALLWEEGYYKVNKRGDGEIHGWNPKVVSGMNKFLRSSAPGQTEFDRYREAADEHAPLAIKDLLRLRFEGRRQVDCREVEGIESIRRRFTTAGMSLGALSPEAHECLAIAMNSIGGKSNSGEGGEDPARFKLRADGTNANSAIKQVASGRFGVTAAYLQSAQEIEIKMAQGAKPGEGGQLPGHKVTALIARLRYSVPGVTLISPPPHHDIYSIEDLSQLIFDLKQVNPTAQICVKLVACSGVGTIAAGVAKAYADVILISGHDGGTGASPLSSIKNAGSAWEIGLAEAHQVLMMNQLRGRVRLRTDGGMKTGRDIVIATLLGAEEFNFGTAALVAAGCAMFRVCHLNTCPVGVATQREDLRAKFRGKPENVIQYFNAVAEDVRRIIARLGFRSLEEMVGRVDLLEQIEDPENSKSAMLDLSGLLHAVDPTGETARRRVQQRNHCPSGELSIDEQVIEAAAEVIAGRSENSYRASYSIGNIHRNLGTRIAGEVARLHGNLGMSPGLIDLSFTGSAGQSFGAFLVQGIRLNLKGEANDYVGKGMAGGELVVRPEGEPHIAWKDAVIMGNTCLYGATGGILFACGQAGERFAVRNSGAIAVVDAVGDHGCEYMTGGLVLILGSVGRNFAAGMSGGVALVYDRDRTLGSLCNLEMVKIAPLEDRAERDRVRELLELYVERTGSVHATQILGEWSISVDAFRKVSSPTAAAGLNYSHLLTGMTTTQV